MTSVVSPRASRWRWLGAGLALWTLAACGTPEAKPKPTPNTTNAGVGSFRLEIEGTAAGSFQRVDVGARKDVKPDKLVAAFKGAGNVVLQQGSGDGLKRWLEGGRPGERKVDLISLDGGGKELQRRTVRVCTQRLDGHKPAGDKGTEQARQLTLTRCPGD